MDAHEQEQARADFRTALTGLLIGAVALAIIMGTAAYLAVALH